MNEKVELNFFHWLHGGKPKIRLHLCTLSQVNLVEFVADILDRNKKADVHFICYLPPNWIGWNPGSAINFLNSVFVNEMNVKTNIYAC